MKKNYLLQVTLIFLSLLIYTKSNAQCIPTVGTAGATGDFINNFSFGPISNLANGDNQFDYALYPQSGTFTRGSSYTYTIQTGNMIWAQAVGIWIDYNGNNVFTDAGEFVYASTTPVFSNVTLSGSITIPASASLGVKRMRVCSKSSSVVTASESCGIIGFGEYEDYNIVIISSTACSGTVLAGSAVASTTSPCAGTNVNIILSGASYTGALSYVWQQSANCVGPWTNISTVSNPSAATPILNITPIAGSSNAYRCQVICFGSGSSPISSSTCVTAQAWYCTSPCYGISTATTTSSEEILNVTMGSLNNTTTCANPLTGSQGMATGAANKYANFTGIGGVPSPNIYKSIPQSFSVTIGTCSANFPTSVKIYIDYNHNASFADAGEEVYSNNSIPSISPAAVLSGTFTAPASALTGCTRMRVINMSTSLGAIASTGTYKWGETEDYSVNIIAPSPFDPTITAIATPSGNCFSNNETFTVNVCNYGSSNINLASNNATVILNVDGPNGINSYPVTLNSGVLTAFGTNCATATFPGINLYEGGNYSLNATVSIPSVSNGNLFNDSLSAAISKLNNRPSSASNYTLCQGNTIPPGQGLTVTGCAPTITDSIIMNFIVTGPCIDNVGSTAQGSDAGAPSNCADEYACAFAHATLPTLPSGSIFTNDAVLTISNLGTVITTFYQTLPNEVRMNLYGASPSGSELFSPGLQGSNINTIDNNFMYSRMIPSSQIQNIFSSLDTNDNLHIGYWESFNDTVSSSDIYTNASGTTVASLKIYYQYSNPAFAWFDAPTGGSNLYSYSYFDPFSHPNGLVNNSSIPGTYTFYAACANDPGCRLPVNLNINAAPNVVCTSTSSCQNISNGSASVNINNTGFTLNITAPTSYQFNMAGAVFGPSVMNNPLLGDIVYYSSPDTGCVAYPTGTFAGKIALIDRGSCFFETKVNNAQNAGAIGVIIVNNIPGAIFTPGQVNLFTINIPSVMISKADGQIIKNMLSQATTVSCNTALYPYNILWNTGNTSPNIGLLPPGFYSADVTDVSGCSSSCTTEVFSNQGSSITCSPNHDCNGTNNNSITAVINDLPSTLNITFPTPYQFNRAGALYGPPIQNNSIIGDIVYYSNPDTGCVAYPPGTFNGKIALIDRGSCPFELKTFNAQNAGALGVIIVNNVPDPIFTPGPVNLYTINIPCVMISQDDGLIIKNMLSQPSSVSCETVSTLNYNFIWSNGATTPTITNIPYNTYTVTVTNPDGCASTCDSWVANGSFPVVSAHGTNDCNLQGAGSASITIHDYPYQIYLDAPIVTQAPMTGAIFGPDIETHAISGDIIYYSNPDTGCVAYPPGFFTGKIALIDRGSCPFELKVFNAQNAGAIGVIIVNNVPDPIFTMGAVNLYNITIPALMVSQTDGQGLKDALSLFSIATCHTKPYGYEWHRISDNFIISNNSEISGLSPDDFLVFVADGGCAGVAYYDVTGPIQAPTISSIGKSNICADSVVLEASGAGKAIDMNGIDQWIDLGADITNLNDANFTIEAWVKTTGFNEGIVVSSNNDNVWELGERALFIDTFGRASFVGFGNDRIIALPPVNDGNWHHIAVTWDYYNSIGRMYVDGVDHTIFETYIANGTANIGTFNIGRPNFGEANNFFSGEIDEVKIWNTARLQHEIMYGMSNPENPTANGLRAYYKMNEGAGILAKDQISGYHGALINSPAWTQSGAFGYSYLWSTSQNLQQINVSNAGAYSVNITTPTGCNASSDLFNVNTYVDAQTIANGSTSFCTGGAVTLSVDPNIIEKRYASSVLNYSSQYGLNAWGAIQTLGIPDVYPTHGDILQAWTSAAPDDPREHLELGFLNPAPINFIDIYETFNPGAIDTVYVKNPNTGLFEIVYSSPAVIEPPVAKILHITFPMTSFPVSEIRIALNSGAVPTWNEIDAVAIGKSPVILWSNGATTNNITVDTTGFYYYAITYPNACSDSSSGIFTNELPCNVSLQLKLFIEGYYTGGSTMASVLLNQGIGTSNTITDSIQVLLYNQNFPYNVLDSTSTILNTDGTALATFNSFSDAYYVVIKHRNAMQTWSALPITLNAIPALYDFSSANTQAFGDNLIQVEPNVWALYSGDIVEDENIDLLDIGELENDVVNFQFGYFATDINGDGNVDLLDAAPVEANINGFIFSSHP